MPDAVADFRTFRPTPEQLIRAEYDRMPGRAGRKYDLNSLPVREAMIRWKTVNGIPLMMPLSESERTEFELWLTGKRLEHKEKSP